MAEKFAISILMPCYNRAHDLLRVLQAYDLQTTDQPFEIIAIDDASQDQTFEVLSSYRPRNYTLRPMQMEQNSGQGRARNRIIPLVESPLVLFTGDDILPRADFIERHLQAHTYFPEHTAAILGYTRWPADMPVNTLMAHIDGVGAEQFSFHYLQNGHTYDYRHFYTSNISLKTELLHSVDYWFDHDFIMYGFEDVELGFRLAQNGMRIYYLDSLVAYHYHFHTIWSFSNRQYKVGLMAHTLARKHRAVAWFFKGQYRRIYTVWAKTIVKPGGEDSDFVNWIEKEALRLLSFYEWYPHRLLDGLYSIVLEYFYYKGLIDAVFAHSRFLPRIHHRHAQTILAPALAQFMQATAKDVNQGVVKIDPRLVERLAAI